jgi:hypothetical protein
MNIIIAILIIIGFLSSSIYFIYLTFKKIDKSTDNNSFMKNILDQAKGRNIKDNDYLDNTIINFHARVQTMNKIQDMRVASDKDTCTKPGTDMFSSGKCHWCCTGSSYIDTQNKIYCYNDGDTQIPNNFVKFVQDPCSCTKEREDVNQYGCCFPCCDGLNMYSNDKSKKIQCYAGNGIIPGYTIVPGNICKNTTGCPKYPQPLI